MSPGISCDGAMMKRFDDYGAVLAAVRKERRLLIEAEQSYFPCTHPIVGSLMVRNWGLPATVGLAIRFVLLDDIGRASVKEIGIRELERQVVEFPEILRQELRP